MPYLTYKFTTKDYKGATIEDLDIPGAISVNPTMKIVDALNLAFEYEFSYLPVINEADKNLLGILDIEHIRNRINQKEYNLLVKDSMKWFSAKAKTKYEQSLKNNQKSKTPINAKIVTSAKKSKFEIITPLTPLEVLASFFNRGNAFAIITNDSGTIVYGVVTPDDLSKYEKMRPHL